MKRRQLLQMGVGLAAVSLFPLRALATPVAPTTYALKGFNANDPATVNLLAPKWTRNSFGTYLMSYNFGATELVLDCSDVYSPLDASNIAILMTHPNYSHWWLAGYNEPDLGGITAQNAATKIVEHINLVSSVDPLAKFSIAGLSQYNACFKTTYFQTLWNALPQSVKNKVSAVNVHYYPQAAGINDGNLFLPANISTHLTKTRNWLNAHGLTSKELWVTEIGMSVTAFTLAHPNGVNTRFIPAVRDACANGLAQRWAIYLQEGWGTSGYHCLMDNGTLTPMGTVFTNI